MELDELFSGDAEEQEQPAEGDTTGQATEDTPQTTGEGDASPDTTQTDSATPDAGESEDRQVPLAALKSERKKRQSAEEHLRDVERKLAYAQGQQAANQKPAEAKKPFEWTEDAVLEDIPGAFTKVESNLNERIRDMKFKMSHAAAKAMYPDYDDVMSHLDEASKALPYLGQSLNDADMPALTAYQAVKDYQEQLKAPKNDAERIEAEVQKRLEVEIAKLKANSAGDGVPSPLSSARGSGAGTASGAAWNGPTPLKDLFGGR